MRTFAKDELIYLKVMVEGRNPRLVDEALRVLSEFKLEISDDPAILISIGGDGTTLYNYKKHRIPVFPVRTFESLGYISDVRIEEFKEACKKLAHDLFYVDKRLALDVYKNERKIGFAINDVTIMQVPKEAMRCSVFVNGRALFGYKKIMGDGIIVATPTGSTGYNRSAGGYILQAPDKIVATLRYPVFLESQEEKSKVLDKDSVIEFRFSRPEEAFIVVDSDFSKTRNSDKITIKESDKTFDLVKIEGMEEDQISKERRRKHWHERQLF